MQNVSYQFCNVIFLGMCCGFILVTSGCYYGDKYADIPQEWIKRVSEKPMSSRFIPDDISEEESKRLRLALVKILEEGGPVCAPSPYKTEPMSFHFGEGDDSAYVGHFARSGGMIRVSGGGFKDSITFMPDEDLVSDLEAALQFIEENRKNK